jgi:glycosyltransferase involved in cell wall biosynthesis
VILEASAMQLPVVSTRLSGIPEAVEDERSGLLVTPGASGELADALARLLDDRELRRRFGEHGRRLMEERFDVEVNVKQLYEMFVS